MRGWGGVWKAYPRKAAMILIWRGFWTMRDDRGSAQWLEVLFCKGFRDMAIGVGWQFWAVICYNPGDPRNGTLKTKYSKGSGRRLFQPT